MRTCPNNRSSRPRNAGGSPPAARHSSLVTRLAFSLIEILVVIALLSVIILGLLVMFNQTQRAFRTGMTQVDVLEAGRAATDIIARELAQMTPLNRSNAVNFYVGLPNYAPLLQPLPGAAAEKRLNLLEEMFFLTHENQTWSGIAYLVTPPADGVATLYRYSGTNQFGQDPALLYNLYLNTPLTNWSRIIEGVVHFKVRAYDTNGKWLTWNLTNSAGFPQTDIQWSTTVAPGEIGYYKFFSNAVPAFVEFELGILEERALARAKSIPNTGPDPTPRKKYLETQAGRVQIFRTRVPVRNVDPTAYQ